MPGCDISSNLPRNGDTYAAPALAARSAWLAVNINVTLTLIPYDDNTLVALSPSTVIGILTTMLG